MIPQITTKTCNRILLYIHRRSHIYQKSAQYNDIPKVCSAKNPSYNNYRYQYSSDVHLFLRKCFFKHLQSNKL